MNKSNCDECKDMPEGEVRSGHDHRTSSHKCLIDGCNTEMSGGCPELCPEHSNMTQSSVTGHGHCRCMQTDCTNRHYADCDICKPNGNELRKIEKEKETEKWDRFNKMRFGENLISIRKQLWSLDIPDNQLKHIYEMCEVVESQTDKRVRSEVLSEIRGIGAGPSFVSGDSDYEKGYWGCRSDIMVLPSLRMDEPEDNIKA